MPAVNSEGQLCNLALIAIGQRDFIGSLNENSVAATLCSVAYPVARDECLSSFWWSWATGRATLPLLSGVTRTGWGYCYALPSAMLEGGERYIETGSRPRIPQGDIPFSVEANDAGNALLLATDAKTPELVFTRKVTEVVRFPALFVRAVAARLAIELASGMAVKPALAKSLEQKAFMALNAAVAADLRSRRTDEPPPAEWTRVRGGRLLIPTE
jgi:hypothetical protein